MGGASVSLNSNSFVLEESIVSSSSSGLDTKEILQSSDSVLRTASLTHHSQVVFNSS